MKITFKKALATIAMFGLLGSFALNVNAAAINMAAGDSAVYNDETDTVTVNIALKDFASDNLSTLRIVNGNTSATVANTTVAQVTANNNGSFVVTNATELNGLTDGIYSVSFVTVGGDFGSATFTVGSADQIIVTANVLPILSMKVTGGAVAFGDLVADTAVTSVTTTAIAVNTNAANGYTMQVANSGLKDAVNSTEIESATASENLSSGYGYGINATIDAGATVDTKSSTAGTVDGNFNGGGQIVSGMSSTPATLSSSTGPVSAQTTTVSYHTRISALQETGNYTDTITYSITGAF
jgi:hypothetical protein